MSSDFYVSSPLHNVWLLRNIQKCFALFIYFFAQTLLSKNKHLHSIMILMITFKLLLLQKYNVYIY